MQGKIRQPDFPEHPFFDFPADSGFVEKRNACAFLHELDDGINAVDFRLFRKIVDGKAPDRKSLLKDLARAGTFFTDNQPFPEKVLQFLRLLPENEAGSGNGNNPFCPEYLRFEFLSPEIALNQGNLNFSVPKLLQKLLRIGDYDSGLNFFMIFDIPRQRLRDDELTDGQRHSEFQQMLLSLFPAHFLLQDRLVVPQGHQHDLQLLCFRGQADFPVLDQNKFRPVIILQEMNMLRHRRLRDMQFLSRLRVASFFADCKKCIHAVILHLFLLSSI